MCATYLVLICSIFAVSITACEQNKSTSNDRSKLQELSTKVEALEERMRDLKTSVDVIETFKDLDRIAYLTPGQSGYSSIQFDIGTLTVSLEDVKPYANGSKVTLMFGNPLAGNINGLKAKMEWGSMGTNGQPDNKTTKSRDITFKENLRPGSWTRTQVVLEGVPPDALGFVRIRDLQHTGIVLNR